jgi:hypothetical protein
VSVETLTAGPAIDGTELLGRQSSEIASMSLAAVRTAMNPVSPFTWTLASPLAAVTPVSAVRSVAR